MSGISEKKWEAIIKEAYSELYKNATPSADFDELLKKGEKIDFNNYRLSLNKQEKILDDISKKYKLKKYNTHILKATVYLGGAPLFEESDYKRYDKLD